MKVETLTQYEWGPITKVSFDNGAVFLYHCFKGMRGASFLTWFLAGSRHETEETTGLAHVLEHMLFKGSQNYCGFAATEEIEKLGGDVNAYTTKEYAYYELNALAKRMPKVIPIFFEMLLSPVFNDQELKKEKNVITQELLEDWDDYELLAEEKFFEKAYPFKLGHSIGGTVKNVKNFSIAQLKSFYKKHYRPERMVLSFVGDCPIEKILPTLEKKMDEFGFNNNKSSPIRPKLRKTWSFFEPFDSRIKRKCEVSQFILGFCGVPLDSNDRGALIVLDHLLTDGMSSRLFKEIRASQGLAYGVSSSASCFTDFGSFEVNLSCPKSDVSNVKKRILKVFAELGTKGPQEEDLDKSKRAILDYWELSFDDLDERNTHMGGGEIHRGSILSMKDMSDIILNVEKKKIQKVCQKMLNHGFSTVVIGP